MAFDRVTYRQIENTNGIIDPPTKLCPSLKKVSAAR